MQHLVKLSAESGAACLLLLFIAGVLYILTPRGPRTPST